MIEFKTGDILSEDAGALVNAVNCVGVMGKGVALRFKKAFPGNFKAYAEACGNRQVTPGRMFVFKTGGFSPSYIINFPTKTHWRNKSLMEYIDDGLKDLRKEIRNRDIRSIAIPALGCGLGGLSWNEVRPRVENALQGLEDVRIVVFEPLEAP